MIETKIYVGLNDADTLRQKFDDATYISLLKRVCYSYHVAFSFTLAQGGYFHENGDYTQENTLIITLLDAPDGVTDEIAKDLCVFFHQESVMVTSNEVRTYFIRESL